MLSFELCGPVGTAGLLPDAPLDAREWFLDEEAVIFPLREAAGPVGGLTTDFAVPFGYDEDAFMDAFDKAAGPVGMFCGSVVDGVGTEEVLGVVVEDGGCWLTGVDVPDPDVVAFPTA